MQISRRLEFFVVVAVSAVVILLAANLLIQIRILSGMPPTTADFLAATSADERRALGTRIPVTRIDGTVDAQIRGTVEVELRSNSVRIENEPLEVYIVR